MEASSSRTYWSLAAVACLWGLAGALDQPPADSQETGAVEAQASIAMEPITLQCYWFVSADENVSTTRAPLALTAKRGSDVVSVNREVPALRCRVLDFNRSTP